MAKPDDIDANLTLELDGSAITPAKFQKGVNAFVGLLETLTKDVCQDDHPVDWRIQVKSGSALIGACATAESDIASLRHIQSMFEKGLAPFKQKEKVHPSLSDAALGHVETLSSMAATDSGDDTRIGFWVEKKRTEITSAVYTMARAARHSPFNEIGSVEGQLSVLSERHVLHFVIYEPVFDKPVKCVVPASLVDQAMEFWRRRVAAHGIVHYRRDGIPTKIDAKEIEIFPDDISLPSLDDIEGILRSAE